MTYEEYKSKYAGAKINPSTKMFWQVSDIAKVEGTSVDLVQSYIDRYVAEAGLSNPDLGSNQPPPKSSSVRSELEGIITQLQSLARKLR